MTPTGSGRARVVGARPNQLWVSLHLRGRGSSTWPVIDGFAQRIVGWRMSASLKTDFVLDALEQTIYARGKTTVSGLVHHSDRARSTSRRATAPGC